jgi:hypothetical protein
VKVLVPTTIAVLLAASVPAFACDKDEKASFPMQAAAFQEKVDAKAAKIRARTEARLKEDGVTAEVAKQERARVEAVLTSMQAAARKVASDGVVTADEAKSVRELSRTLRKNKKDKASRS